MRPSAAVEELEAKLASARVALAEARRVYAIPVWFDPSHQETRAQGAAVRVERASAVDAAQAAVAAIEIELADARIARERAIADAASFAISAECAELTVRLQRAMPELMRIIETAIPYAADVADLAQVMERDLGDPLVLKSGAALGCPSPVVIVANLAGWLAQARAAGWVEPQASAVEDAAGVAA